MIRITIRLSEALHDKLRWKAYRERRSQHSVIIEALEARLQDVQVPEEAKDEQSPRSD